MSYVGRAINYTQAEAEGKYKIPVNFLKSLEVFNLNQVIDELERFEKYFEVSQKFTVFLDGDKTGTEATEK